MDLPRSLVTSWPPPAPTQLAGTSPAPPRSASLLLLECMQFTLTLGIYMSYILRDSGATVQYASSAPTCTCHNSPYIEMSGTYSMHSYNFCYTYNLYKSHMLQQTAAVHAMQC